MIERCRLAALDLAALALLLSLALLLLIRQIGFGGTFYNDDIVLQSIPAYTWYSESLMEGRVPIWSPAILGGFPLAFAQYGFFYPPDMLLFWLLDAVRAFHLSLGLHLALAGSCVYWYCRVLNMRRLPSLVAAVAFQMGNEVVAWPANGYITKTLFAMPALLATVELMFRRGGWYWLLIPPIVGGAILVGYAQFVLFALAVAAAYVLVVARAHLAALGRKRVLLLLALFVAGIAGGLALAAVRVMPTLAVTALSTRSGGMDFGRTSIGNLETWSLIAGYMLPAVYELPGRAVMRPDYVGPAVLVLALLALVAPRRLGRVGGFHGVLLGVATILSLGNSTPAFALLMQMPFFSFFRGPARLSLVAALAMAVLAAHTLDQRLVMEVLAHRRRRKILAAAGMVLCAIAGAGLALGIIFQYATGPTFDRWRDSLVAGGWDALNPLRLRVAAPMLALSATPLLILACARGRVSQRALEWFSLLATAGLLLLIGWFQYPWLPSTVLNDPPVLLKALSQDTSQYRVFSWAPRLNTYNVGVYYSGVVGHPPSIEFNEHYLRQFIPPNLGMIFGVDIPDGYEALQSRRQALLAAYIRSDRVDPAHFADGEEVDAKVHLRSLPERLDLLAAINVKYLIHAFPIEDPRLEIVDEAAFRIYSHVDAVARVYLHRVKNTLPRAFVVPESVVMSGEREVLEALTAGAVDLRQMVILEETAPRLDEPRLSLGGSRVEMVDYREERVVVRVSADGSGFLVLMDFLMPGWTVKVDGRSETILAGNFAGRAVPLRAAGDHIVEFSYEAPLLREGLLLSSAVLALLVIVPSIWFLRSRRVGAD